VDGAARVAKNESFFREVNEQIRRLEETGTNAGGHRYARLICECSTETCTIHVDVALEEYREVRSRPTQFLVAQGHVDDEHERVLRTNDRFWIVEKIGAAGSIAAEEQDQ
jgi:hypothetical protein